jgi:hypothetical protein
MNGPDRKNKNDRFSPIRHVESVVLLGLLSVPASWSVGDPLVGSEPVWSTENRPEQCCILFEAILDERERQ